MAEPPKLRRHYEGTSQVATLLFRRHHPGLPVGDNLGSHLGLTTGLSELPAQLVVTGFMLAIASPTIAAAATIEEVAHCRAIQQLAERLECFKSLKPGPRAKRKTPHQRRSKMPDRPK